MRLDTDGPAPDQPSEPDAETENAFPDEHLDDRDADAIDLDEDETVAEEEDEESHAGAV